jgi:putative Mg2+ transporter-C (MgtC) family protein
MLVTEFILQRVGTGQTDPTRIAAQVVTGIGFLGAGTIIQSRGTISGLTSAATIWVVAGIGLTIGAGFPWIGLLGSIMTIGTLNILHRIEPRLLGKCHFIGCNVIYVDDGGRTRSEIAALLSEHDIDITKLETEKIDQKSSRLRLIFCDKHPTHHRFLSELWRTQGIVEITRDPGNGSK